jgi:tetratricopeptide (TPR) repeat protein
MIRRALERDPDNGAYVDSMGWVLYRLGRLTEARKELERAALLTSGDAVVLEHLGDVYRDLHLVDLARQQYQKALAAQGDGTRLKSKLDGLR